MAKINRDVVKAWCKKNQTSDSWLSEAIGHNRSYLSYYFSTKSDMPKRGINEISDLTGISFEDLTSVSVTAEEIEKILEGKTEPKLPAVPEKNDWILKEKVDKAAENRLYNESRVTREEFLAHAGEGEREAKLKREQALQMVSAAVTMPKCLYDRIKDVEITLTIGDLMEMVGGKNA